MGKGPVKHGESSNGTHTPEYSAWACMISRCHGNSERYKRLYQSRGITVCERWRHSFENFLEDMGRKPGKEYSLDRIDNDKGYSPDNCRWATQTQQLRNSRSATNITFNGKTMCIGEWAIELGIERSALLRRIQKWGVEKALTTPVNTKFRNSNAKRGVVA